jgi:hypothetical protein
MPVAGRIDGNNDTSLLITSAFYVGSDTASA